MRCKGSAAPACTYCGTAMVGNSPAMQQTDSVHLCAAAARSDGAADSVSGQGRHDCRAQRPHKRTGRRQPGRQPCVCHQPHKAEGVLTTACKQTQLALLSSVQAHCIHVLLFGCLFGMCMHGCRGPAICQSWEPLSMQSSCSLLCLLCITVLSLCQECICHAAQQMPPKCPQATAASACCSFCSKQGRHQPE